MLTFEKVTEKNEEDLQNNPNVHHQENNKTPKQGGAGKLDRRHESREQRQATLFGCTASFVYVTVKTKFNFLSPFFNS